ncbi:hypothetical protein AQ490_04435 [Wenjunlia vitaminophila]|uniref:Protein-glutamine gamma-glutamyltransferase-like C-terminal domain-containing protein n=1 Tax=Wenjunlia vitaminophila TaxID=76728 RepID=A0A0T6LP31_WENVI|nr:DUF4129 domain-containing protein [Wenjunlia vitaminophila]KRV47650.1 hypothetical protein AQ490_04435 [Wenjunlia vitaminophila]
MTTGLAALAPGEDVPVTIPRDPAREAARRELSEPVYHQDDPNLIQRGIDWIWDTIGDLLSATSGAAPGGWVGIAVIVLVVLLAALALRLRLGRLRTPTGGERALFDERPLTAAEHRAAAERHSAAQHWDAAVRERMRALVRGLEERTLLDPRPGRTADEAATAAGRVLPEHAARLRAAARAFDDVCYGGRHAGPDTYQHLRDLDVDVENTKPLLPSAPGGAVR